MFEELFEGPIARARQRESPLPEERRRFLSHLQALGYQHSSRATACELIVVATRQVTTCCSSTPRTPHASDEQGDRAGAARRATATAAKRPKTRRPTKPKRAAKEKRLESKRQRSEVKSLRGGGKTYD
jgi:hypothetical protein